MLPLDAFDTGGLDAVGREGLDARGMAQLGGGSVVLLVVFIAEAFAFVDTYDLTDHTLDDYNTYNPIRTVNLVWQSIVYEVNQWRTANPDKTLRIGIVDYDVQAERQALFGYTGNPYGELWVSHHLEIGGSGELVEFSHYPGDFDQLPPGFTSEIVHIPASGYRNFSGGPENPEYGYVTWGTSIGFGWMATIAGGTLDGTVDRIHFALADNFGGSTDWHYPSISNLRAELLRRNPQMPSENLRISSLSGLSGPSEYGNWIGGILEMVRQV